MTITNRKGSGDVFLFILIMVVVLFFVIYNLSYALTSGSENIVIDEKWEKKKGDTSKYLVSSMDGQVFEITDSWIRGRWDSSNLYAKLKTGMICDIETQGWRAPFFSDYKNIIEADCRLPNTQTVS